MKILQSALLAIWAVLAAGCGDNLQATGRLRLPKGDVANGKAAFVALNCVECHTVNGVADLPKPTVASEKVIELGGGVARLRTTGDLLTAIVHPAYSISEKMTVPAGKTAPKTEMREVNDRMTVKQMIDLVTFLQPQYRQLPLPGELYYTF